MVASEKAIHLVNKFRSFAHCPFSNEGGETIAHIEGEHHNSKQCALIACDEIIDEYWNQMLRRGLNNKIGCDNMILYWKEVKNEISKL